MFLAKANQHDLECYDKVFPAINSSDTNSTGRAFMPDRIRVTVRQWHETKYDTTLKNENVYYLSNNGSRVVFQYTYPNPGFSNQNPRALTMSFDGIKVRAAIRKLMDTYSSNTGSKSEWEDCKSFEGEAGSGSKLEYHQYLTIRGTSISSTYEKLEIDVAPEGTPDGPYYDNECLDLIPDPEIANGDINPTDKVTVTVADIYKLRNYGANQNVETVRSEVNVTLTSEAPTVKLQYNQTVATGSYGFQGDEVQPRNLTLTLDPKTGAVIATMAELDQAHSYIYDHFKNTEDWLCKKVALVKNETDRFSYVSYAVTSSLSNSYIYYYDILSVTRSSSTSLGATSFGLLAFSAMLKAVL